MELLDRLQHGWNAFINNRDPTYRHDIGNAYSYRPDRPRLTRGNERSFINSIYNRIALDVSEVIIQHVQLDEDGRLVSIINSGLNNCLNLRANLDQSSKAFIHDVVMSMLDEGVVTMVPVDTTVNPDDGAYDIQSMRTGKILDWYPQHVKVRVYNEQTGQKEDLILSKKAVAIIENPFYSVMNEPNSTVQRLIRKLNLLDAIDEQSGSGKLDLIIQLPYVIKSDARRKQAEQRRKDIEVQLAGSKYGIAYTDGTERITQLNRPVENNLLKQIEYLTSMAHAQLSITQGVMDGTADEKTMTNYNVRTVGVIVDAIVDAMKWAFLTKTARTQMKSIMYYRDPFKLATLKEITDAADTFTRNEIMSKNEIRQKIGMKPSDDPKADQLINSNISHPDAPSNQPTAAVRESEKEGENQNGVES